MISQSVLKEVVDITSNPAVHTNMARKEQLLHIAQELFAVKGYERTKISDIVAAANVSQGTFYWHFKSKESIAVEMIDLYGQELLRTVSKGYRLHGGSVSDSVEASRVLFKELFSFAEKNRYFMEIFLKGMHSQPAIQDKIEVIRQGMEQAFTKNITRAGELSILPGMANPERQAAFLSSLVEGVLSRWLIQPGKSALNGMKAEELAADMVAFEFFGLIGKSGEEREA